MMTEAKLSELAARVASNDCTDSDIACLWEQNRLYVATFFRKYFWECAEPSYETNEFSEHCAMLLFQNLGKFNPNRGSFGQWRHRIVFNEMINQKRYSNKTDKFYLSYYYQNLRSA